MKLLLAMLSKGKDIPEFFPDVVKNVVARSIEVKKMVYIYLVHYADFNDSCREIALPFATVSPAPTSNDYSAHWRRALAPFQVSTLFVLFTLSQFDSLSDIQIILTILGHRYVSTRRACR